jgi:hypothetical protein
MVVDIDRFNERDVKHGVTTIRTANFTANTIAVGLLHGLENLVHLQDQGFIFLKRFRKIQGSLLADS